MRTMIFTLALTLAAIVPGVARKASAEPPAIESYGANTNLTATTTRIGDFSFTRFSNGESATTTRIGDFETTRFSNGATATTTTIGDFGFTTFSRGSSPAPADRGW